MLNNSDFRRNITDLKPFMHDSTRWSVKLPLFQLIIHTREYLMDVNISQEGDIAIDTSGRLLSKVSKFKKNLSEIDFVSNSLQAHGHTVAALCDDFYVFAHIIGE